MFRESEVESASAFLGFSMVQFGTFQGTFNFGSLNPRDPSTAQVNRLKESIEMMGLRNDEPEHALICLIAKDKINPGCLSKATAGPYPTFEVGVGQEPSSADLDIVAGQHRLLFLFGCHSEPEMRARNAIKEKLTDPALTVARAAALQQQLAEANEALSGCRWLVSFYDIGEDKETEITVVTAYLSLQR
jgi:hypothetical protein